MPELPEVEYTRKNLTHWVRHARITSVKTTDALIVRPETPAAFARSLASKTVERVERRGKWLKLTFDDGRFLFAHLGMTGWFERVGPDDPEPRFERVRFDVEKRGKRARIAYVDSRRWGRMILAREDIATWKKLGPDPLDDGIDLDALEQKLLRRKKRSIKEALMDQTVLAGVGNIQAIEALWKARIDPRSKTAAIVMADLKAIAAGLRWTIARTLIDLDNGAGAEMNRVSLGGSKPPNPFRIYGRQGAPCPRCGTTLDRIVLGGRTTTFCPGCQERRLTSRAATLRA